MKQINNFENVQATTGEFAKLSTGGYICKITLADDIPFDASTNKGDYLKIEYDIAVGEFKDYYKEQYEKFGNFWGGTFFRSYKEKALGMFKHFIECVEKSNSGFVWTWDEKTLMGKVVGLVLAEEEYENNNGEIKTRLYVAQVKTVEEIKNGDFKVPELKKVKRSTPAPSVSASAFTVLDDTDEGLPF